MAYAISEPQPRQKRASMNQPAGWVVWLTGLPASGKTTLAYALRGMLLPNSNYTPAERDWFYNRLSELAIWLARGGEHVIIAATGSRRCYREAARARLGPRFAEVWVCCPAEVCRSRDLKGLYG